MVNPRHYHHHSCQHHPNVCPTRQDPWRGRQTVIRGLFDLDADDGGGSPAAASFASAAVPPPAAPAVDEALLARRQDPETSRSAGLNAPNFARGHEARILAALAAGPGTKDELAGRCGLTDQQVIRRMHSLERAGLVETTGATRLSASGRPERVYRATETGGGWPASARSPGAGGLSERAAIESGVVEVRRGDRGRDAAG